MSIRRAARPTGNFTILDNAIFAAGLSYRAMGMLAYLLSKPDHWEVSVAHLVNVVADSARPDGRDGIYTTITELIGAGFIVRTQARDGGRMAGFDYEVFDTPQRPAPDTAEPDTAEPTQVRTETPARTDGEENPPTPQSSDDAAFEETWRSYPKRAGGNSRQAARKAWDARRKQGHAAADLHAGTVRYAEYIRATGREGTEYVKQAATFWGPGLHFAEPWDLPRLAGGNMHNRIDGGQRSTADIEAEAEQLGFRTMGAP